MSMVLNDEQERALGEMMARYEKRSGRWWRIKELADCCARHAPYPLDDTGGLAGFLDAIAPLMRPWTHERYELGWLLRGPVYDYFVQPHRGSGYRPAEEASIIRLRDLLNESEARK